MKAEGVVCVSGLVSSLTLFFGCWDAIGERGLSGLEVGLVRFFVLCVVTRRGVLFEGGRGNRLCLPWVCVIMAFEFGYHLGNGGVQFSGKDVSKLDA